MLHLHVTSAARDDNSKFFRVCSTGVADLRNVCKLRQISSFLNETSELFRNNTRRFNLSVIFRTNIVTVVKSYYLQQILQKNLQNQHIFSTYNISATRAFRLHNFLHFRSVEFHCR